MQCKKGVNKSKGGNQIKLIIANCVIFYCVREEIII